ncbi:MAG: flagellar hook-length control protein FliK [Pigmentiphaga sp.]
MNSALGSLLATRLDAVLGTTLAQHPVLLNGARGHSATQPTAFLHGQDTTIRRGTGELGEAAARAGQAGTRRVGQGVNPGTDTAAGHGQASARTVLSEPARTILALLLSGMDGKTAVQGRQPLLPLPGNRSLPASVTGGPSAPNGPSATSAAPGPSAQPGTETTRASPPAANLSPSPAAAGGQGRPAMPFPAPAGHASIARASLPQAPANMVPAMASALQRVVGQSGMFYESHLAQMAFGQRSPAEVAREPQARLDTSAPQVNRSIVADGGVPASGSTPTSNSATHPQAPGAAAQPAASSPAGVLPDAAPLVRQQLEVLANQAFIWQGEAWNGTPLQWEVQRRAPEEADPEALGTWATRLALQLPRLGSVEARLTLAGDRLVLRLGAPESAPLLQQHLDVLREHLERQGLQLTDTTVSHQQGPKATQA